MKVKLVCGSGLLPLDLAQVMLTRNKSHAKSAVEPTP